MSLLKIHSIVPLFFALLFASSVVAQHAVPSSLETTSVAIARLSSDWKTDTVGQKGLRAKAYESIRYSKVDSITKNSLIEKLGKPNSILRVYRGVPGKDYVQYRYYTHCMYWDKKSYMGGYIAFVFDENESQLLYITDGDICG